MQVRGIQWVFAVLFAVAIIHTVSMLRGAYKNLPRTNGFNEVGFRIVYGTAWKKEKTAQLVYDSIRSGFRAIDTAGQPKHYREDLVGEGIHKAIQSGIVSRPELFIQTKFSPISAQDTSKPMPYDPAASIPEQVQQSILNSLANLRADHIDSLLLHSPYRDHADTMAAWAEMEQAVHAGQVGQLGISNIYDVAELQRIISEAEIKPAVVQNRFYAQTGFDTELRQLCRQEDIMYQSFWTLSANRAVIAGRSVTAAASRLNLTPEQLFYRFVMELGGTPLSGTTSLQHMSEDVAVASEPGHLLTEEEMASIDRELRAS